MNEIIGRKKEISELKRLYAIRTAEFVAIYGRRHVGKTFLVDETLSGKITFRHAGLSPVDEKGQANNLKKQLQHFYQSLQLQGMRKSHCPKNWLENMCEMKFYSEEFTVSKVYHKTLVHRSNLLLEHLSPKMAIHPILITTYGLTHNEYSREFINCVTFNELFES